MPVSSSSKSHAHTNSNCFVHGPLLGQLFSSRLAGAEIVSKNLQVRGGWGSACWDVSLAAGCSETGVSLGLLPSSAGILGAQKVHAGRALQEVFSDGPVALPPHTSHPEAHQILVMCGWLSASTLMSGPHRLLDRLGYPVDKSSRGPWGREPS